MSIRVRALASGSSGNALLVQAGEQAILIDAGLPGRQLAGHLHAHGVAPGSLSAILVTHEHSDHTSGVSALARLYKAPVVANRATLAAARLRDGITTRELPTGTAVDLGRVAVTSFPIPHDAAESVGYALEYDGWRMCLATDVGFDAPEIEPHIAAADLVVLEANHDIQTLRASTAYPWHLKRRILGNGGHLSNDQTAALLERSFARGPAKRRWLWLAHLSEENNTPRKARDQVSLRLDLARAARDLVIDVAARDVPSATWHSHQLTHQLSLF